jgi:hypothetical protein
MENSNWRVNVQYLLQPTFANSLPEPWRSMTVSVTSIPDIEGVDLTSVDIDGLNAEEMGHGASALPAVLHLALQRNMITELALSGIAPEDFDISLMPTGSELYVESILRQTPLPVFGSPPHDWVQLTASAASAPVTAALITVKDMGITASALSVAGSLVVIYIAGPIMSTAGKGAAAILDDYIVDVRLRAQERRDIAAHNREEQRRRDDKLRRKLDRQRPQSPDNDER